MIRRRSWAHGYGASIGAGVKSISTPSRIYGKHSTPIGNVYMVRAIWLARLFLPSSLVKLLRTVLGGRDENSNEK